MSGLPVINKKVLVSFHSRILEVTHAYSLGTFIFSSSVLGGFFNDWRFFSLQVTILFVLLFIRTTALHVDSINHSFASIDHMHTMINSSVIKSNAACREQVTIVRLGEYLYGTTDTFNTTVCFKC